MPCGANRATVIIKFDKTFVLDGYIPVAKFWLHSPPDAQDASGQLTAATVKAPTDPNGLNAPVWLEKDIGAHSQGRVLRPQI